MQTFSDILLGPSFNTPVCSLCFIRPLLLLSTHSSAHAPPCFKILSVPQAPLCDILPSLFSSSPSVTMVSPTPHCPSYIPLTLPCLSSSSLPLPLYLISPPPLCLLSPFSPLPILTPNIRSVPLTSLLIFPSLNRTYVYYLTHSYSHHISSQDAILKIPSLHLSSQCLSLPLPLLPFVATLSSLKNAKLPDEVVCI